MLNIMRILQEFSFHYLLVMLLGLRNTTIVSSRSSSSGEYESSVLTLITDRSRPITGRRNRTEFIDVEYHAYFAPVFVSLLVRNVISFKNYYYYEYRVLLFHLINH